MNLIDIFFPKQCIICSRVGFDICNQCLTKIPKALPTCLLCNKVSNNGYIHKHCFDIEKDIYWIHGWNLLRKYKNIFNSKRENNLFSVYKLLLEELFNRFPKLDRKGRIEPMSNCSLDRYLSSMLLNDNHSATLYFVGEKVQDKEELIARINRACFKNIFLITIF